MAKIQFKGKEGGSFTLITPGDYDFQIESCEMVDSKKDVDQVKVVLKIVDGPFANESLPKWIGLDDKQGWVLRQLLDATGTPYALGEAAEGEVPTCDFDTDDLLQRYVKATITHFFHKEKQKTYHNVDGFKASTYQQAAEGSENAKAPPAGGESKTESVRRPRPQA